MQMRSLQTCRMQTSAGPSVFMMISSVVDSLPESSNYRSWQHFSFFFFIFWVVTSYFNSFWFSLSLCLNCGLLSQLIVDYLLPKENFQGKIDWRKKETPLMVIRDEEVVESSEHESSNVSVSEDIIEHVRNGFCPLMNRKSSSHGQSLETHLWLKSRILCLRFDTFLLLSIKSQLLLTRKVKRSNSSEVLKITNW